MPTYNVLNKKTGKTTVQEMKIAEMEAMLAADPNLDVVPSAVPYGDPFQLGRIKPDSKFREHIKKIKAQNPRNNIDGTHI